MGSSFAFSCSSIGRSCGVRWTDGQPAVTRATRCGRTRDALTSAIQKLKLGASVGIGMGQVNRVDAARLAVARAGERAAGAVAASDAFFPFADGLQTAAAAGATAVIQPGGSVRDAEVIAAADEAGLAMVFTGMRHFRH